MPLTRSQKESLTAAYERGLAKAPHVFVMGFSGISVPQVTELRSKVRETGGKYVVVKNRLVLRAIAGEALEGLSKHFEGPIAVAFGDEDAVSIAKAVSDFAKDVPAIQLKGGLVDGREVAAEEIEEIASLPSREELIGKLLFLLQSPISSLVRTLNGLPRQFVAVVDQIRAAKETTTGVSDTGE